MRQQFKSGISQVDKSLSEFWIAGVNYKKTDATIRGRYAINHEQYNNILAEAHKLGLNECFILSTCNRTEIYGLAHDVNMLIDLVCNETAGDKETFKKLAYIKRGTDAIEHLFNVSAGLDSQVLGDYEVIGQVKQAAKQSKEKGFIGAFFERLINCALQSSKAIKTTTELSGGTVSVSFAAIQYIREHIPGYKHKNILLIGTGKIGRNTCKNLVDYLHNKHVTLINRTAAKAISLANELGVQHAVLEDLPQQIQKADIIITSTNAPQPIITTEHLAGSNPKLIIDLAIPYNVDIAVKTLDGITLLNVDELSKLKDDTLQKRMAEIPKAKAIIDEHIQEFIDWLEMRRHAPVLKSLKKKLQQIESNKSEEQLDKNAHQRIQRVITTTAVKLQKDNQRGCYYIEAINEYIA